jgi:hypothetical protein
MQIYSISKEFSDLSGDDTDEHMMQMKRRLQCDPTDELVVEDYLLFAKWRKSSRKR